MVTLTLFTRICVVGSSAGGNCRDKWVTEYVKINQLNALLYFFYDGSYTFWQDNAILMKRLCSLLSHFSVNRNIAAP
jgi:hypothetical protein